MNSKRSPPARPRPRPPQPPRDYPRAGNRRDYQPRRSRPRERVCPQRRSPNPRRQNPSIFHVPRNNFFRPPLSNGASYRSESSTEYAGARSRSMEARASSVHSRSRAISDIPAGDFGYSPRRSSPSPSPPPYISPMRDAERNQDRGRDNRRRNHSEIACARPPRWREIDWQEEVDESRERRKRPRRNSWASSTQSPSRSISEGRSPSPARATHSPSSYRRESSQSEGDSRSSSNSPSVSVSVRGEPMHESADQQSSDSYLEQKERSSDSESESLSERITPGNPVSQEDLPPLAPAIVVPENRQQEQEANGRCPAKQRQAYPYKLSVHLGGRGIKRRFLVQSALLDFDKRTYDRLFVWHPKPEESSCAEYRFKTKPAKEKAEGRIRSGKVAFGNFTFSIVDPPASVEPHPRGYEPPPVTPPAGQEDSESFSASRSFEAMDEEDDEASVSRSPAPATEEQDPVLDQKDLAIGRLTLRVRNLKNQLSRAKERGKTDLERQARQAEEKYESDMLRAQTDLQLLEDDHLALERAHGQLLHQHQQLVEEKSRVDAMLDEQKEAAERGLSLDGILQLLRDRTAEMEGRVNVLEEDTGWDALESFVRDLRIEQDRLVVLRHRRTNVVNAACAVCKIHPATHCFVGCGHKNICEGCADHEMLDRCPICRRPSQKIRVYD